MSYPTNYVLQNNHPLITREQNYVLDRKLLTIHSEDRDITKWKKCNHFEIMCPQVYTNVQSIRLAEIGIPCNYYNFSKNLQNTKFSVTIIPVNPLDPLYGVLWYHEVFIDLSDGYYENTDLANTMTYLLNKETTTYLKAHGFPLTNYDHFHVKYNSVKEKMVIANNLHNFRLNFSKRFTYDLSACIEQNIFDRYNKWGFPAYIGYVDKKDVEPIKKDGLEGLVFPYESNPVVAWIIPDPLLKGVYYSESPLAIDILGHMCIYLELEKYNNYDELKPYVEGTTQMYNNDYNAIVNSAFAKIPLIDIPKTQIFDSLNGFLSNLVQYDPPIEKISKFKLKFRYHDGTLVDFQRNALTLTLEINQLRNEIHKKMNIRVPAAYNLT